MIAPQSEAYVKKALLAGSVCAVVAAALNPFDVVKVRMQSSSGVVSERVTQWVEGGVLRGVLRLVSEEGVSGCSRGVHATMLREVLYSSFRM